MAVGRNTLLVRSTTIHERSLLGMTLLRRPEWSDTVTLNGEASWVWSALSQPCSVGDLAADVAFVTGVDFDLVADQLAGLIEELLELGAIAQAPIQDHS